jgi:hypothetical protein
METQIQRHEVYPLLCQFTDPKYFCSMEYSGQLALLKSAESFLFDNSFCRRQRTKLAQRLALLAASEIWNEMEEVGALSDVVDLCEKWENPF